VRRSATIARGRLHRPPSTGADATFAVLIPRFLYNGRVVHSSLRDPTGTVAQGGKLAPEFARVGDDLLPRFPRQERQFRLLAFANRSSTQRLRSELTRRKAFR